MKLKKKIQQSPSGGNKSIKKEKGKPTTDLKYSFRDGSSLLSLEIEIEKKKVKQSSNGGISLSKRKRKTDLRYLVVIGKQSRVLKRF